MLLCETRPHVRAATGAGRQAPEAPQRATAEAVCLGRSPNLPYAFVPIVWVAQQHCQTTSLSGFLRLHWACIRQIYFLLYALHIHF